jgi:hypothetical protein
MSDASIPNPATSRCFHNPTHVIACALLAMIGIGMSAWAYRFNDSGPILTWGILPGAPFVILAGLSLVTRIPLRVTIGAYVGGVLAVAVPYAAIWYSSLNYNGGGANIGLGLLLMATLVLLPIPMLIGGFTGWMVVPKRKKSLLNETNNAVNPSGGSGEL